MDLKQIANVSQQGELWYTSASSKVSYPSDAHSSLARVEDVSFWFKHRNDLLLELMKRFPVEGRLLDIGGGRGFVSRAIQETNPDVILIEPDEYAAKFAKSRGVKNVICGTFQDAGFVPESIDAVGLFDVVEHIDDSVSFLKGAKELLRPGGLLFATVPSHQWLWSIEDEYAGHFRRYTPQTLTTELESAGFAVEYLSFAFSFLVLPVFLIRSIPSKLGIRGKEPDSSAQEHVPSWLASQVLESVCGFERRRIANAKTLPTGSSLIVVARKH